METFRIVHFFDIVGHLWRLLKRLFYDWVRIIVKDPAALSRCQDIFNWGYGGWSIFRLLSIASECIWSVWKEGGRVSLVHAKIEDRTRWFRCNYHRLFLHTWEVKVRQFGFDWWLAFLGPASGMKSRWFVILNLPIITTQSHFIFLVQIHLRIACF